MIFQDTNEVELELEFSFVSVDLLLDVELELAGRFAERGRALSELELQSDDFCVFTSKDVTRFGTEGFFA